MSSQKIFISSLEDLDEKVTTKVKDANVRLYGPMSQFFCDLLNQVFCYSNQDKDNKRNTISLEEQDGCLPNSAMITKIMSDIEKSADKGEDTSIYIQNKKDLEKDDLVKVGREMTSENRRFILILNENSEYTDIDQNGLSSPLNEKVNIEKSLEELVSTNGGTVYRALLL